MPARPARRTRPTQPAGPEPGSLRFGPQNAAFLGGGVAAVVAGFVALGAGSTVAAPLLLVLGYAVLIPIGIIR